MNFIATIRGTLLIALLSAVFSVAALADEGIYSSLSFFFPLWYRVDGDRRPFMLLFFDEEMHERAVERMRLEAGLRQALDRDEFRLVYQPQYELSTRKLVGVEALLRWNDPAKGLVPPADFFPLAEETGLILPLGEWLLDAASKVPSTSVAPGVKRKSSSKLPLWTP